MGPLLGCDPEGCVAGHRERIAGWAAPASRAQEVGAGMIRVEGSEVSSAGNAGLGEGDRDTDRTREGVRKLITIVVEVEVAQVSLTGIGVAGAGDG